MAKSSTGKVAARKRRFVSKFKIFSSFAEADRAELEYWRSKTPAARLRELERLRQFNYGYGQGKPLPRFQRVLRVIELGES